MERMFKLFKISFIFHREPIVQWPVFNIEMNINIALTLRLTKMSCKITIMESQIVYT